MKLSLIILVASILCGCQRHADAEYNDQCNTPLGLYSMSYINARGIATDCHYYKMDGTEVP